MVLPACVLALYVSGQAAGQEADSLVREAQERARSGKVEEALALMKKAVAAGPDNHLYHAMASDYARQAGQYADGLASAEKALGLNDKVGAYHVLAAANALGVQDLARARKHTDLVLKGGVRTFGPGPVKDARALYVLLAPRTFTFTWKMDPRKGRAERGTLTLALPRDDPPRQKTTYEIEGARSHRLVKGPVNDTLRVVPNGDAPFKLVAKVTVTPHSFKKELAAAKPAPLPAEARASLGPAVAIDPRSPAVRAVAAKLRGRDTVESARNVLAWMKKNIEYKLDKNPIGELDFRDIDEILKRGHAECRGYTLLFVTLCRALGVPARPIWGLLRVAPEADKRFGGISSHSWAEIYVAGVGWVPVDPQGAETLGCLPNRCVRIFMDEQKTTTRREILPVLNLMGMYGEDFRFEERVPEPSLRD